MIKRQQKLGVLVFVGVVAAPFGLLAQDDGIVERRLQITLASVDSTYNASVRVGRPVVVSRADVDSPMSRIRSLEEGSEVSVAAPVADPAFKAVLLTPRAETGRPAQTPGIQLTSASPNIPVMTDDAAPAASPRRLPESPAAAKPKQQQQQPKAKAAAPAAPPKRAQPTATARAPSGAAPKFGRTEVEASRAFTRF